MSLIRDFYQNTLRTLTAQKLNDKQHKNGAKNLKRHFSKDIQKTSKHMKRRSTS